MGTFPPGPNARRSRLGLTARPNGPGAEWAPPYFMDRYELVFYGYYNGLSVNYSKVLESYGTRV